ncbi:hypothetical protein BDV97DRAFT_208929 [Delphinella strobiligena]|nr:hypothetical protein BDV97DRAFT_208929 [Delphinella strobiligena]
MAAKFCCTIPSRSSSPEDAPRPLKHLKSTDASRHPQIQESQRLLEIPELLPPVFASSDDLELRRIFVAASLPDDHPDALRIHGRNPGLDESIVRSPSFTTKLRRQLSRKSLKSSRSGTKSIRLGKKTSKAHLRSSTILDSQEQHALNLFTNELNDSLGFDPDALSLTLNESRFQSLRLQDKLNASAISEHQPAVLGEHVHPPCNETGLTSQLRSCPITRCVSVPGSIRTADTSAQVRRSRSISSLGEAVTSMQEIDSWQLKSTLTDFDASWQFSMRDILTPISPQSLVLSTVQEQPSPLSAPSSALQSAKVAQNFQEAWKSGYRVEHSLLSSSPSVVETAQCSVLTQDQTQRPVSQVSEDSVHLFDMQISQHLRSQSQQSQVSSSKDPHKLGNQRHLEHASLNSVICSPADLRRLHNLSETSCVNATLSPDWGQSIADASSSIYSHRPSTSNGNCPMSTYTLPYDILNASNRYQDEPPKTSLHPLEKPGEQQSGNHTSADNSIKRTGTTCNEDVTPEKTDPIFLASPLPKSSSSTSLGRMSKFREDMAMCPTKRKARKRRSVLDILFPKLAKPKFRSVSSPFLCEKIEHATAMFDGPSDDRDLLAVPGQASGGQPALRSLSLSGSQTQSSNELAPGNVSSTPNGPTTKSLDDYELTLSISGDDRRRKSAIDADALKAPQGEQGEDLLAAVARPLNRAQPLARRSNQNSLMEKALHQHQLEKAALFRGNSKRSVALTSPAQVPVFNVPFSESTISTSGRVPVGTEDVDPLEAAPSIAARRSQSMHQMRPAKYSSSPVLSVKSSDRETASMSTAIAARGRRQSAGGLVAWSRYPSHTRETRCGSASREDNVLTHDFGDMEGDQSSNVICFDTPSTGKTTSRFSVKKRTWIIKSRSMTFGSVMRYYSSLFTSSAARNRRSSVTIGGKLEHPELEILPPIFPAQPFSSLHHGGSSARLSHFVDHIKEEIREEGHLLKEEIKEEGHHLKDEIKEEGQRLREEGNLLRAETHNIFSHHSSLHSQRHQSAESLDPLSSANEEVDLISDDDDDAASKPSRKSAIIVESNLTTFDGTREKGLSQESGQSQPSPTARRLSRMYQAYVQIPTSMDANTEGGELEGGEIVSSDGVDCKLQDVGSSRVSSETMSIDAPPGLLCAPTRTHGCSRTSSVIRKFPSVTVVDDRKGHWRSISLISAQSGKSLRNSTNDLLDLIKEAEHMEREKLMKVADVALDEQ